MVVEIIVFELVSVGGSASSVRKLTDISFIIRPQRLILDSCEEMICTRIDTDYK